MPTSSPTTVGADSAAATGRPAALELAQLAVPGLIWGTSFLLIAEGLEAFPPSLISPMRIGFGFVTLAFFARARASLPRSDWARIAVLGVVWMAFPLSMFPFAETRVSSGVTGMLNGATPIFVAGIATLIARRPPPKHQVIGLAVGSLGVALIALPTLDEGASSGIGVALILSALLSYGIALNLAVPLIQRHGSLPVMWRTQAVAFVLTVPFALRDVDDIEFRWLPFFAIAALGVFGTAMAYVLAASNAGRYGPTRASITTYVIPVVAVALGAVLRDERVFAIAVVGSLVTLVGAWLAGRRA